jgi:alpha-L-arabinofuranosidase
MSRFGGGDVLRARVDSPSYAATYYDPRGADENRYPLPAVPYLKLAAVHQQKSLSLFALNRSLDQPIALDLTAKGFSNLLVEEALELRGDLEAVNTKANPDRVRPASLDGVTIEGDRLRATLAPASWNLIRLGG